MQKIIALYFACLAIAATAFASMKRKAMPFAIALSPMGTLMLPSTAHAFAAPSSGSFGYDIYDIVINKMLAGPLGWVGAAMLLIWGISNIMKQWLITVLCVVGATCIIKITTILTSLGAVIN